MADLLLPGFVAVKFTNVTRFVAIFRELKRMPSLCPRPRASGAAEGRETAGADVDSILED
jgi:hypothetical protein